MWTLPKTDVPKFKVFMPLAVDTMPTDISVTLFIDSTEAGAWFKSRPRSDAVRKKVQRRIAFTRFLVPMHRLLFLLAALFSLPRHL